MASYDSVQTSSRTHRLLKARQFLARFATQLSRHPIGATFIIAFAARSVVAIVIRVRFGGYVFLDDRSYLTAVRAMVGASNPGSFAEWQSTPTFTRPLVMVGKVFGIDPVVSQLVVALVSSLSVAVTAWAALRWTSNRRLALGVGSVLALFPSAVLWSSVVLKDSFIWLMASSVMLLLTFVPHRFRLFGRNLVRVTLCIGGFMIIGVLAHGIRAHAALVLVSAAVASVAFTFLRARYLIPVAIGLLFVVPLALGFGPFASTILDDGSRSFANNRAREVAQAESPLECWPLLITESGDPAGGGWENDLKCLPSSFAMFLTQPWPHHAIDNPSLVPPLVELPLWLGLYVLAWRSPRKVWRAGALGKFLISYVAITTLFWAFVDRVIGTAFRHRSEILASLVMMASIQIGRTRRPDSVGDAGVQGI